MQKIIIQGIPYFLTDQHSGGDTLTAAQALFLNHYRAESIRKLVLKRLVSRPDLAIADLVADLELTWQLPAPPDPGTSALEQEVDSLKREYDIPHSSPLPAPLQREAARRLEARRKVAMAQLAEVL